MKAGGRRQNAAAAWRVSFCLLLATWCLPSARAESIGDSVRRVTSTAPFTNALWFIRAEDDGGKVLADVNGDKLAITASTRKLFAMTTVTSCLPADTRFHTQLFRLGDDVVIRGDGDPSFGAERYGYDAVNTFQPFVDALRRLGVVAVRDVVADVSEFDRTTVPGNWKVGNLPSDYSAPIDALTWNENAIDDSAVASPGLFAAQGFRDALQRSGIAVTGMIRLSTEPRAWGAPLAEVASPFLEELLFPVLKNSQNLYAETLFKRVSAGAEPASYAASLALEQEVLTQEAGLLPGEVRFVDGSGLAPDDLATPAAVIKVLRWMNAPGRRSFFWTVLAQPGEIGTLHVRLEELHDRMRGKTGTVNGVNALAGIVRGSDGTYRYFVVELNHHLGESSAAVTLIDSVARAIADF